VTAEVLGFIGLGRMGGHMSARLVAAGYPLVGYDAAGTRERLPPGAEPATSAEEIAATAEVVCLSLPDGAASRAVCQQVAAAPHRQAHTVIDLSTIGIRAARECAALAAAAGLTYVDAPVSGGVAGAASGSLAAMVGAPAAVYERVQPLLGVVARNCFRVGDAAGQGQAMKLLNNYLSAAALAATSEAVVFGARQGLDLAQMIDVINVSSGRSTASSDKFPRSILPRTYDFGFAGAYMTKDVRLYLEAVEEADTPHALGAVVTALWQRFHAAHPDADFTYLHHYLEEGGE
jgi:3-hydroxyisobutyrate dehydrogenase-like beta-hydroxyacid dehydrogenase